MTIHSLLHIISHNFTSFFIGIYSQCLLEEVPMLFAINNGPPKEYQVAEEESPEGSSAQ